MKLKFEFHHERIIHLIQTSNYLSSL